MEKLLWLLLMLQLLLFACTAGNRQAGRQDKDKEGVEGVAGIARN